VSSTLAIDAGVMSTDTYASGYTEAELDRLVFQARLLDPMTERLLWRAGVRTGMRVLDVGSGAGDVALLAAGLVGPSGSVTGVDRDGRSVALAEQRAVARGLSWARFREAAVAEFTEDGPFDAVIGRYVLVHQAEPAAFLRAATRNLRPGGVIAFHEIDYSRPGHSSSPEVPLWDQVLEWTRRAIAAVCPHADAGGTLVSHFADAGLPTPQIYGEFLTGGGPDSEIYRYTADAVRSLLPVFHQIGVSADEIGIETLEARLRTAVVQAQAQVKVAPQFLAHSFR
jgi:ubiquinone/menaquinone biosynthesis C-methylase UbiE